MLAVDEHRVSTLAHRIGLRLVCVREGEDPPLYQLVEPYSMTRVLPGGGAEGALLGELEDWLYFPWE